MKELPMTKKRNWRIAGLTAALQLGVVSFLLVSHGRTAAGEAAASVPDVEVVSVEQKDIPVYREWIGTLDGLVNAAIRSQVTGYLLTQNYSEGSFVKKGQLLFEIDPRPLQAAVDQARGQLADKQCIMQGFNLNPHLAVLSGAENVARIREQPCDLDCAGALVDLAPGKGEFPLVRIDGSVTRPMASTGPNIESVLIEKPNSGKKRNVPTSGQQGDKRCTPVLQEQIDDSYHQHDGDYKT
jgi:hypothetical protein